MNKIRYRAFDKHMKMMGEVTAIKFFEHMYDHVSVRFTVKGKTIDESYNIGYDGGDNIILMQDTGLKDKNGARVFEGDILHWDSHWGWYVGYENGAFRRIPLSDIQRRNWEHYPLEQEGLETWEIIGNIYDNPELLGDRAVLIQDAKDWPEELLE